MTEAGIPLAGDCLHATKTDSLPFEPCVPPCHPAIWPCQVCGMIRVCLYGCRQGVRLPVQPVGCSCGDAVVPYMPEVMR